jgi:predicted Zn-dependent peptidase
MKYFILLIAFAFTLLHCSPKSGEKVAETSSEMKEESKENFRSQAPSAGPAPALEMGEYSQTTLDNGLQLIVVENHKLPRVSFQLFVDSDPILEQDQAGYVSMTGNLLKTGTKNRSKEEIDEAVDFIGANLSTSSRGAFGSCLVQHKETLLDLMSDVVLHPAFNQEEFEKLKKQELSGISASKNNPNAIASNIRSLVNYSREHPYGEFPTEESIENISMENCKSYYNTYFKPNISYLVVVGDIKADEAKQLAASYFGGWESANVPDHEYEMPQPPAGNNVVFVDRPGAVQSVINITYPVDLKLSSEDYVAARVMNNILGGGVFSGYLMQNLREDKAFTYGARASLSPNSRVGNFNAYASVRNEVTDSSIVEFLYEMNRIRNEKVADENLELVKNSMNGSFARSLERPQTVAQQALSIARYDLPKDFYENYLKKIESITKEDVLKAAQTYIKPESANILIVGNKDEVAEKVDHFDANASITFFNAEGEEVVASANEIPEGTTVATVLNKYIEALGGAESIRKIRSIAMEFNMEVMSMTMKGKRYVEIPNKFAETMEMNGMVAQKQVYNDGEGMAQSPQGKQMLEGDELASLKLSAHYFEELHYGEMGYTTELVALESIDGKEAYKVKVTPPSGNPKTLFFDAESGLKIRELSSTEGQQGPVTITLDYSNYETVEGVKFPMEMELSGPMPQPIQMKTQKIEVNTEISPEVFSIEK